MGGTFELEIQRANQFGDAIEDLVVTKGECPTGDRNILLLGYWSLIFDHLRDGVTITLQIRCNGVVPSRQCVAVF